ncbi:MAG: alpha/beta fold hydrolase [Betaproteobacteria bacterium]
MNEAATLPIGSPSLTLLGSEPWRAAWEFLTHTLGRNPVAIGDGHPVIIFPGMATDGRAVAPLRKHCESLGYTAFDWGRGYNTGPQGDFDAWLHELATHISGLLKEFDQQPTLIGLSLGGLYARELAKLLTPQVRQVITIGTPFNAAADHTNVGWLFRLLTRSSRGIDPELSARLRTPPPVPTTSIYSRSDGIVAWQTCRHDVDAPEIQDIEVDGSHCGMGWNPAVLDVIANRLGQRPGKWRPHTGNGLLACMP